MTKEKILNNYQPIPYCGCFIWDSCLDQKDGYGTVWFQGKQERVHRVVYELVKGPIPKGMCVCHHCDTPSCMNIDHLFLGTSKDNTADMWAKDRHPKGEDHPASKLTEKQVTEIKGLLKNGKSHKKIAKEYGVCGNSIWNIKSGKAWAWLK